jgi:hypothetical protein
MEQQSTRDVQKLVNAFNEVKEEYCRYLTVFNYFDPNSLGTISEVLLAKLLNNVEGIKATHTGGSQGLTDLVVDGHSISLKTTDGKIHIGLGSDKNLIDTAELQKVLQYIKHNQEIFKSNTIKELEDVIADSIKLIIAARIEATIKKLVGESGEEFFVWIEKIYDNKKILSDIVIHIVKFNREQLQQVFNNAKIHATPKAWGIVGANSEMVVKSDISGKILNVTGTFIKQYSQDTNIKITLEKSEDLEHGELQESITRELFISLDNIYRQCISGE